MSITVRAMLDPEASVWYVAESNLPGLNIEAESFDALVAKLPGAIADLTEAADDAPTALKYERPCPAE